MAWLLPGPASAAVVPSRIHLDLDAGRERALVAAARHACRRRIRVGCSSSSRPAGSGSSRTASLQRAAFIDISRSVSRGGEQGLLGLAFHPSYETNGKLYLSYTDLNGTSVIREYRVSPRNPDRVDGSSGRTLLRVKQPYANHNGGHIAFGPDGYLYIGLGDGGSGGDPGNRAQNRNTLLGKLLRIDVNQRTGSLPYGIPSTNPYVGRTRARPDLGVRAAQPVALLVRPRDRRPVDRRRRPGLLGRGRPRARDERAERRREP